MSAEERLAALLREAANEFTPRGPASWESIAARLVAAGVSVPTEPGAPDPWGINPEYNRGWADGWREGKAAAARLASRPVPAPEPSARLREAVAAWWASFRPLGWTEDEHLSYPTVNIPVHEQPLARAYVESRAATPQDPEETR